MLTPRPDPMRYRKNLERELREITDLQPFPQYGKAQMQAYLHKIAVEIEQLNQGTHFTQLQDFPNIPVNLSQKILKQE
jgi:hypothetical protein